MKLYGPDYFLGDSCLLIFTRIILLKKKKKKVFSASAVPAFGFSIQLSRLVLSG